jgi:hypothetical protein
MLPETCRIQQDLLRAQLPRVKFQLQAYWIWVQNRQTQFRNIMDASPKQSKYTVEKQA